METNLKLELAERYIANTHRNIFLTGKAGTGKTTFLKNLTKTLGKRFVVLAPTGIAALNADGQTMHSFLQLSLSPYFPGCKMEPKRIRKNKLDIIRSLDLIIIDEISMVRADVLDQMDYVLRKIRYRQSFRPFGGVQLLLIGDLSQLPPVMPEEEWQMISPYYETPYFFSSYAWQQSQFHTIELDHIYRQSDKDFIQILNQVRENKIDESTIRKLNACHNEDALYQKNEGSVILCTHNHKANAINEKRLEEIDEKTYYYHAQINGDFEQKSYPNKEILSLKEGAQVMFIKNDYSEPRRYFNGSIGKVVELSEDKILVCLQDCKDLIEVEPYEWEKVCYEINKTTKEITQRVTGTFKQYPLRLAWAITIHKSQGLTFDKAIIDADQSFTHGQYYVALSRCRSLKGVSLTKAFNPTSVITDRQVRHFSNRQADNQASEYTYKADRQAYLIQILEEVFSFKSLSEQQEELMKQSFAKINQSSLSEEVKLVEQSIKSEIFQVSERFILQLQSIIGNQSYLEERCLKACEYFLKNMNLLFTFLHALSNILNDEMEEKEEETLMRFGNEIELKCRLLNHVNKASFDIVELNSLKNRIIAEGDRTEWRSYKQYVEELESKTESKAKQEIELELDDLYSSLKEWRLSEAKKQHLPAFCILNNEALRQIVSKKPQSIEELETIKGIGKKKIENYAEAILQIIEEYTA